MLVPGTAAFLQLLGSDPPGQSADNGQRPLCATLNAALHHSQQTQQAAHSGCTAHTAHAALTAGSPYRMYSSYLYVGLLQRTALIPAWKPDAYAALALPPATSSWKKISKTLSHQPTLERKL
eukprot:1145536-Pelagomonas_calceolata.AAC.10